MEMPVSASPFNTVCMMGDAPRQRGSNEGWTFRMPLETWITDTLQWQHHWYQNHLHTAMTASLVPVSFAHCNDSMSLVLVLIICALQWHTDSMSLVPESFAHCNDSITGTSSNHLHIAMTVSLMPELFTDTMQGHHITGTRMIQTQCNDSVTVQCMTLE